jgi:Holliday junction resolvase
MKARVYESLKALRQRFGPRECGKLCQKLLAIAFRKGGYRDIVERGVQGVDVDARRGDHEKYTIEAKTTTLRQIPLKDKDVAALQERRRQDGYQPVLAVLRIHAFYQWIFARAESLEAGLIAIEGLRPYRLGDLETLIDPLFDAAVSEHCDRTLAGAQVYLDRVLRQQGVRVEDMTK